jgi:hypothetical protein
MAKVQ